MRKSKRDNVENLSESQKIKLSKNAKNMCPKPCDKILKFECKKINKKNVK